MEIRMRDAHFFKGAAHGRSRHHHHHQGPPPFGPWAGGPGFGRRRRMRRGDVRAAILVLLDEEARNGYGLMQEIEERSDGEWRPSPGSVYPALSQLEDEGLIRSLEEAGRKAFELTDAGRAYVEENREALGTPWELDEEDGDAKGSMRETRDLLGQVIRAAVQVLQVGDERQQAEARTILTDTRKSLYRLLAEDDDEG